MRLWGPATFLMMRVCRRRGFRYRSAAIRHTFIFPIACSTTIRRRDTRRLPAFCRSVNTPFGGRRRGVRSPVPRYAVSPVLGTPRGHTAPVRSYTLLSCVVPGNASDTAAVVVVAHVELVERLVLIVLRHQPLRDVWPVQREPVKRETYERRVPFTDLKSRGIPNETLVLWAASSGCRPPRARRAATTTTTGSRSG